MVKWYYSAEIGFIVFFCNNKLIPIDLISNPFLTTTLSDNPISKNYNADAHRLNKLLYDFDIQFYKMVEDKINECIESLTK